MLMMLTCQCDNNNNDISVILTLRKAVPHSICNYNELDWYFFLFNYLRTIRPKMSWYAGVFSSILA